ncbi:MAG: caspase family protein [Pseudomonadota bacterium]
MLLVARLAAPAGGNAMKTLVRWFALLGLVLSMESGVAQMMRPPAFAGGVPGRAQFQSILLQRHQARTLLYREALEELRKNPQAADLPPCGAGSSGICLAAPTPPVAPEPVAVASPPAAETVEPATTPPAAPRPAGRRLALLFGNNDYAHPIPPLETPIADVSRVAEVLKSRFGFEARVVKNAGQSGIIEALNQLAAEAAPDDRVLLFYAGHGYLMEDIQMGFWIPVDASVKTAKGWISNSDISKLLGAIRARQLILVSDSCFSGSLTKEQRVTETQTRPEEILQRRSVVVLSSGGDEPVSDEGKDGHSIFAWNLIRTLESTGDLTPGVRVWKTVHGDVMKDFPQEPQYGAVVSAGHVAGGDFLFQPQ